MYNLKSKYMHIIKTLTIVRSRISYIKLIIVLRLLNFFLDLSVQLFIEQTFYLELERRNRKGYIKE